MREISANNNFKYVYERQRPKNQFTGNVSSLCDVRVIISFSISNIHRNFEKARNIAKNSKILYLCLTILFQQLTFHWIMKYT